MVLACTSPEAYAFWGCLTNACTSPCTARTQLATAVESRTAPCPSGARLARRIAMTPDPGRRPSAPARRTWCAGPQRAAGPALASRPWGRGVRVCQHGRGAVHYRRIYSGKAIGRRPQQRRKRGQRWHVRARRLGAPQPPEGAALGRQRSRVLGKQESGAGGDGALAPRAPGACAAVAVGGCTPASHGVARAAWPRSGRACHRTPH